jgi:hypothetical protein
VDHADGHVFADEGSRVREYNAAGTELGTIGTGILSNSRSLGVASGRLAVSDTSDGEVALFGPLSTPADRAYDSPLVIDSVRSAAGSTASQFQTTPGGGHAVFATTLPLDGFDSAGKYEIFRYQADGGEVRCTSCDPTTLPPASDASLASNGLSITDDGRVFFNSGEPLVLRDTNSKKDAYEWSEDRGAELISTGQSRFDAGLLTVSADGTDALFFTRETLAANDKNGTLMKLYTARENGGFFVVPPPPDCRASDECHGPGTEAAAPATLGTLQGIGGNAPPRRCRKGQVKRSGKCVKRKRRHRSNHRKAAHRNG